MAGSATHYFLSKHLYSEAWECSTDVYLSLSSQHDKNHNSWLCPAQQGSYLQQRCSGKKNSSVLQGYAQKLQDNVKINKISKDMMENR